MDLRELRYFAAVFEERNLTAAARRCFISQPSISGAIKTLETEFGTRLFLRHKRGAVPTSAAEDLYPIACRLLADAQAIRGLFDKSKLQRALTLGLMRSLDIARTAALLAVVGRLPEVRLKLVGADDDADARIVSKSMVAANEAFLPLWSEHYVLALPAGHVLTLKDKILVADLAGLPLVDRCHCEHAELFARIGDRPETVAVAQSEEWAVAFVKMGLGAAILPEGVVTPSAEIVLRPFADADLVRQVGVAYGRAGASPPIVKDLLDVVAVATGRGKIGELSVAK